MDSIQWIASKDELKDEFKDELGSVDGSADLSIRSYLYMLSQAIVQHSSQSVPTLSLRSLWISNLDYPVDPLGGDNR